MYQVYIVDDAVLTRKALVMTMPWDQWGCVVVGSADDGEKAFEDIREMEPDIVITDIRMVHVGGLELIGRCRAQGIRSQFIIISGYNEFEYAKAALRMEVLDYILKPIDDEELHGAVEKAVQRIGESRAMMADHREQDGESRSLLLEYDDERSGGFEPLAKVSPNKKVVLGLITSKKPELEDKQTVIARIHEAAKYIPLDRLCLSPQCGFASCEIGNKLTEADEWAKLALVKEIAEEVWG